MDNNFFADRITGRPQNNRFKQGRQNDRAPNSSKQAEGTSQRDGARAQETEGCDVTRGLVRVESETGRVGNRWSV